MKKIVLFLLITGLIFSMIGCKKDEASESDMLLSQELVNLMPSENFRWAYIGPSEYYHEMTIESITVTENQSIYKILGSVKEDTPGENLENFNIELYYEIDGDSIKQTKTAKRMLDSEYDSITLIKTPLSAGTKWTEEVKDVNGKKQTIKAEIIKVTDSDEGRAYEVVYKNSATDYTESRKIMEGLGVIAFSKAIVVDDDTFQYGYGLYGRNSGYIKVDEEVASGDESPEGTDDSIATEDPDADTEEDDVVEVDINHDDPSDEDDKTAQPQEPVETVDEAFEVEKAIIAFNNSWIEYVNNNDQEFFNHVIKNGLAYNNAIKFDKTDLKETFLTMDISNVVVNGNKATAKVYEEIKKEKGAEVSVSKYNWLYDLIKKDDKWYINGYKFQ